MILREKTTPGLTRLGWAMMLGALALMPLMPTLARSQPKREPMPLTMNGLLSMKSCVACHAPPPASKVLDEDMHGRIIRLMDALKKQREQAERTEKELRSVLDKFEKAQEKPKKAEAKQDLREDQRQLDKLTQQKLYADKIRAGLRAEQDRQKLIEEELKRAQQRILEDRRLRESAEQERQRRVEQELKRLRDQVERLQRELEGKGEKPQKEELKLRPRGTAYLNHKAIQIPYQYGRPGEMKEMSLFVRKGDEKKWTPIGSSKKKTGQFDYAAPEDGLYAFLVQIEGEEIDPARLDEKTLVTVVVDTVRPVIGVKLRDRGKDSIEVEWAIEEDNPSLTTLRAEYRLDYEKKWRPITITPGLRGVAAARVEERDKVEEVRVVMRDKAGNYSETIVKR